MSQTALWESRRAGRDESPIQRLWRRGLRALSDSELVSLLLRTGAAGRSALETAQEMLGDHGLAGLLQLDEINRGPQRGVGEAKAASVLAAVELGRRLTRLQMPQRRPLDNTQRVADYLWLRYHQCDQEVVGALYLDVRDRLMGEREHYRGSISRAAVEPRAILKAAVVQNAAAFILFHTHPSGDPAPSVEDLAFTRQLTNAGEELGISLLDHLILGTGGRFVSLKQRSLVRARLMPPRHAPTTNPALGRRGERPMGGNRQK